MSRRPERMYVYGYGILWLGKQGQFDFFNTINLCKTGEHSCRKVYVEGSESKTTINICKKLHSEKNRKKNEEE